MRTTFFWQTSALKFVPQCRYIYIFMYILWIQKLVSMSNFYFKFLPSEVLLYLRQSFFLSYQVSFL
jgi:hypothetical protein